MILVTERFIRFVRWHLLLIFCIFFCSNCSFCRSFSVQAMRCVDKIYVKRGKSLLIVNLWCFRRRCRRRHRLLSHCLCLRCRRIVFEANAPLFQGNQIEIAELARTHTADAFYEKIICTQKKDAKIPFTIHTATDTHRQIEKKLNRIMSESVDGGKAERGTARIVLWKNEQMNLIYLL